MRLGKSYGDARLEKAAERAMALGALSYSSIASILKHGLDQHALPGSTASSAVPVFTHSNIRGADYYT
jgi:hypothetical protein